VKLQVFQADKGDCLLLTSADGKRVLVDGGMEHAYRKHVAPALGALRKTGRRKGVIDLLYVSHIDDDHIGGVLELLNNELDWRVFDFQSKRPGDDKPDEPKVPRPPHVKGIWHNAFDMQLDRNIGPIEDALAASAAVLAGSARAADRDEAAFRREFATGVDFAIRVSHRVKPEQLNIPLNKEFDGKLAMARDGMKPIRLGSLKLTVIGPHQDHMEKLRGKWNDWLEDVENRGKLEAIRRDMLEDAKRLESGDVDGFRAAAEERARELSSRTTTSLRRRPGITPPNLASLMLLVEEKGKMLLLTGDGAGEDVVEGLERAGRLQQRDGIHVDVLKVQHHGATANVKPEFCRRVTADNYIICANGSDHNPERDVLKTIIDSRLESRARGAHAGADRPFKLWFNSSVDTVDTVPRTRHMTDVEKDVSNRAAASGGRMTFQFLKRDSSFEISV
jgi:metallo-beta-lactamase superfamily protein